MKYTFFFFNTTYSLIGKKYSTLDSHLNNPEINMYRCTTCLKRYGSSIIYCEHWRKVLCTSAISYIFLTNHSLRIFYHLTNIFFKQCNFTTEINWCTFVLLKKYKSYFKVFFINTVGNIKI